MTRNKVRGRKARAASPHGYRTALEPLEPRALLAVFTVNSLADILSPPAGTVTLRSAIQAANTTPGPNTINLSLAGTYKISILGGAADNSAGEFAIADNGDLTIQNASGGASAIDGGGLNRVFVVDPAGSAMPFTVTFAGLIVKDGLAKNAEGGGIAASGAANVVLNGCYVAGNSAGLGGGGIAMQDASSGTLTLNGTTVTGNRAAGSGGGGIVSFGSGTVTINPNSAITENAALGGSGGGGILVAGAPLNIVGAIISDNRMISIGATDPGPGGGIENIGAGAVSISGSLIEDNTAGSSGGGYADKGLASLTIRDSFVLDNTAGKSGGGLAAVGPLITLTNVTVAGNTQLSGNAADGGGGLYLSGAGTARVIDSTIAGNTAIADGGGIDDNALAKLIVTGSTVADNHALSYDGGGLNMSVGTGDVSISNSVFRDNSASQSGGGLATFNGTLEIAASRFTGNSASYGGAAEVAFSVFSINGSTFDANRASVESGALVLFMNSGNSLTDSTIVSNVSGGYGAIGVFGGSGGTLAMIDDTIDGNTNSAASGGGVYQSIGTVNVQGTILAGNTAAGAPADYDHIGGTLTDNGGNLLGTTAGTAGSFGPGTILGDPKLGPLLDHGGISAGAPSDAEDIPTQALLPGSPAFGKGVAAGAPGTDERGFGRHTSPAIGAYEPSYSSTAPANAVYVDDLYEVLFNRPVDPAGLLGGVNFLNGGGTPTALAQALESSGEFLDREAIRIVRRYLDRTPSQGDVANIAAYLGSGHTPEQAAAYFIDSAEFASDYGNNQNVFVQALYQTVLGRAGGSAEVAGWTYALGNGLSTAAFVNLSLSSVEYLTDTIASDFLAYLGRPASPSDMAAFLKASQSGVSSLTLRSYVLGASFPTRS